MTSLNGLTVALTSAQLFVLFGEFVGTASDALSGDLMISVLDVATQLVSVF